MKKIILILTIFLIQACTFKEQSETNVMFPVIVNEVTYYKNNITYVKACQINSFKYITFYSKYPYKIGDTIK